MEWFEILKRFYLLKSQMSDYEHCRCQVSTTPFSEVTHWILRWDLMWAQTNISPQQMNVRQPSSIKHKYYSTQRRLRRKITKTHISMEEGFKLSQGFDKVLHSQNSHTGPSLSANNVSSNSAELIAKQPIKINDSPELWGCCSFNAIVYQLPGPVLSGILVLLLGITVKVWLELKILKPQSSTWVIYKASYMHSVQWLWMCMSLKGSNILMQREKKGQSLFSRWNNSIFFSYRNAI